MKNFNSQKRLITITISILVFIIVAIFAVNLIVGNIIENKIDKAIHEKYEGEYEVTIKNVGVNILAGNVTIKELKIVPDSALLERYRKGQSRLTSVMELEVPKFRLVGLKVFEAVTKSIIDVDILELKDASIKFHTGYQPNDSLLPDKNVKEKKLNLDSIQFSGLQGILIGKIELINSSISIYNERTQVSIVEATEIDVNFSGISLNKLEGNDDYFKLVVDDLNFELNDEKLSLPGNLYFLTFKKLAYDKSTKSILLNGIKVFPQIEDENKMAKKLVYTSEIFNVSVNEIEVFNFDLRQIINEKRFVVDSINISALDLDMLKDKRFPWNYDKRPQLPNHQLRKMKYPLYIGQVNIRDNSRLYYHEKLEGTDDQMKVTLDDLNVQVNYITSLKDSTTTLNKQMTINLKSKLMGVADLYADFTLYLNSSTDAFYFRGAMGPTQLDVFNSALKPVAGMEIDSGYLEKVEFSATANNVNSTGKMTMIYSGLTANVLKKNADDKGKVLSFFANSVVHSSNPGKKGKLRVAQMGFERVVYKGFGNFVWKTLQTGIVNTVLPTGKSEKQVKKASNDSKANNKKDNRKDKKKK